MDIVFYLAETSHDNIHLYFKRPLDVPQEKMYDSSVLITIYSPREPIPPRIAENHFRIALKQATLFNKISALLDLIQYELPNKNITVHFGWPTSSWFDRLSTGVMVFQLIKMPRIFPTINFKIEVFKSSQPK